VVVLIDTNIFLELSLRAKSKAILINRIGEMENSG